jgi:hypothetical protein
MERPTTGSRARPRSPTTPPSAVELNVERSDETVDDPSACNAPYVLPAPLNVEPAQTEAGVSRIRVDLVEAARLSAWIDERFRDALATSQPDAPISTGGKKGLPC